ncbi:hypothetical protein Q9233_003771 [Columba guinea]|nr:hypothetical protein Q9233_003771 [Columba guinea]
MVESGTLKDWHRGTWMIASEEQRGRRGEEKAAHAMGKGPQETVLEFWPYLSVLSCQASGSDTFDTPGA